MRKFILTSLLLTTITLFSGCIKHCECKCYNYENGMWVHTNAFEVNIRSVGKKVRCSDYEEKSDDYKVECR